MNNVLCWSRYAKVGLCCAPFSLPRSPQVVGWLSRRMDPWHCPRSLCDLLKWRHHTKSHKRRKHTKQQHTKIYFQADTTKTQGPQKVPAALPSGAVGSALGLEPGMRIQVPARQHSIVAMIASPHMGMGQNYTWGSGLIPCFHLLGFHFGYIFLTHSHINKHPPDCLICHSTTASRLAPRLLRGYPRHTKKGTFKPFSAESQPPKRVPSFEGTPF